MASFFLAPDPIQSTFFIPGGAVPGNGAQLFVYVAGSVSTPTTVYKDNAGGTAWSNPIVLDSGGNLPNGGVVWIPAGVSIKAVWAPSNDTNPPASPYRTIDNISGINDTTASQTEWIAGPTPTFVSASQFTLVGDQTTNFTKGRRLKFTVTAGTVYGTITSSTFGALTTVNVAFASGALDSGLSAVSYSLIAPDNPSINADYVFKQASSVASAGNGTTNIWGVAGNSVHVTGTNAIFNFSTAPYSGAERTIIFDGALSLNSSAAIAMPGNLNVTTVANDRATVYANTVTSSIVNFYKQSGRAFLSSTNPTTRSTLTSSSGTYSPSSSAIRLYVRMIGGGGGGAASAAGNGLAGSSTTFSTSGLGLTCTGGAGGAAGGGGPVSGGTASGGDFNITGGGGNSGVNPGSGGTLGGAAGGNGPFGGAGASPGSNQAGNAAIGNTGAGGSGGGAVSSAAATGGGGGAGGYLEKWIASPATSYTYSVGAGGGGGTGTGQNGGSGGSGVIIIDEYYF